MAALDLRPLAVVDANECPYCLGSQKATVDFYDPSDFYGHGQYETDCYCVEMGIDPWPVKLRKLLYPSALEAMADIPSFLRRKPASPNEDYTLAYAVIAVGALVIAAHYLVVLPYLATYGI